jgi:hypothetical protein
MTSAIARRSAVALALLLVTSCAETGTGPGPVPDPIRTASANTASIAEISAISVVGGGAYRTETGGFAVGARRFIDAAPTFASALPADLVGHSYIRTADADRNAAPGSASFLSFDVDRDVTVYIAHDNRLSRPTWLSAGFADTGLEIRGSDAARLRLFRRDYAKGRVLLGSNVQKSAKKGVMYTVVVVGRPPPEVLPPPPPPPPPAEPIDPSPLVVNECASPQPGWIWCDDFEEDRLRQYFEHDAAGGRFTRVAGVGGKGSSGMRGQWNTGQVGAGSLKLAFGLTPTSYMRPVDAGTAKYREIFWRMYARNPPEWTGGGADKLSRATVFAGSNWSQAMIAHVWSGGSNNAFLVADPASGTDTGGTLLTTKYNDFTNLRWLGARVGKTPIFSGDNLGKWHCVEAHVRLNDPALSNGTFRMWINEQLETERTGMNWLGSFSSYGINAVFLENYWNNGSPKQQERYFDNFIVSTQRIGC